VKKDKAGKRKIDSHPLPLTGEILPTTRRTMTQKHSRTVMPDGPAARKSEVIISALLGGNTIEQAAKLARIHPRTVKAYLASPWFQELFAAAKKNLLDETIANLRGFATSAVQRLDAISADHSVPPIARVSAAREMLSAMLRAVELEDVIGQLEQLKREVRESKEANYL
jgi:hypothetical protein